jgi:hypothetical protein
MQPGHSDAIIRDETKNLIICPVPHDQSFMEVFYEGWRLVQTLCNTGFMMPSAAAVPSPVLREVAKVYVERREFPIGEVLEVTQPFAQPHLLDTMTESVKSTAFEAEIRPDTATVVGPFPLQGELFG